MQICTRGARRLKFWQNSIRMDFCKFQNQHFDLRLEHLAQKWEPVLRKKTCVDRKIERVAWIRMNATRSKKSPLQIILCRSADTAAAVAGMPLSAGAWAEASGSI
jgi:hypothetical protein